MDQIWHHISNFACSIYQLASHWQTMIAGFLALGAAYKTISVIREQINQQNKQHEEHMENQKQQLEQLEKQYSDTLERKKWTAQSQMPDALSGMVDYCTSVAVELGNKEPTMPRLPSENIDALKLVIEHVERDAAQRIFELLNHYQIHNARLEDFFRLNPVRPISGPNIDQLFFDVTKLYALTVSLFDYARNGIQKDQRQSITYDEMFSALRNVMGLRVFGVNEERYESVLELVRRRFLD